MAALNPSLTVPRVGVGKEVRNGRSGTGSGFGQITH